MTPKGKAKELVIKYLRLQEKDSYNWFNKGLAKQCALIAVDEILNSNPHSNALTTDLGLSLPLYDYWQEVKQEIEKL